MTPNPGRIIDLDYGGLLMEEITMNAHTHDATDMNIHDTKAIISVKNYSRICIRDSGFENSNGLLIYTADETTMKFRHNEIISYIGSPFAVAADDNSGVQ